MIDQSWYTKSQAVIVSQAAGGVVARFVGEHIHIALVRESGFLDYILPKGSVEIGETLEEAARREILEEAGLDDLTILDKLGIQERWNYRKTKWKIIHYFLFCTNQVGSEPKDLSHHYSCEWFPLDLLPGMFWPEQENLLEENRNKIIQAMITCTKTSTKE